MEATVCRILAVLLYMGAASPAPQDPGITFVRPLSESPQAPAPAQPVRDSSVQKLPLLIGGVNNQTNEQEYYATEGLADFSTTTQQFPKEEETTASEEDTTATTERATTQASTERSRPGAKPWFPSTRYTSKLSYFKKTSSGSAATNLVERPGQRRFRSRCRCEKIWNCPKLQITVPRCPEEYFMCCF